MSSFTDNVLINNQEMVKVSSAEKTLIEFCRGLEWGEVTVKVKNGQPVMLTSPLKDVKLD